MSLTVRDLINALSLFPPDTLVVLSKDAEGNGYSPLDAVTSPDDPHAYDPETTWSGDVYRNPDTTGWSEEQTDLYQEEWSLPPHTAVPCVVLEPVN